MLLVVFCFKDNIGVHFPLFLFRGPIAHYQRLCGNAVVSWYSCIWNLHICPLGIECSCRFCASRMSALRY